MDFTAPQRQLQDTFDSRRLADRINELLVHDVIDPGTADFIQSRDMMFLSTVDADGQPACSYKGGDPGFVRVLDERTLAFPAYDGNGMFLTLGNMVETAKVGILFIDFENPSRVRVNGRASVSLDDPLASTWPGAILVVRVQVTEVFPNCPRYIHRMQKIEHSRSCPRPMSSHRFPTGSAPSGRVTTCPSRTRRGNPEQRFRGVRERWQERRGGPVRRDLRGASVALIAAAASAEAGLIHLGRTCGSTPEERASVMPGDDLIARPTAQTDHAITIDAPPSAVWPWLVQMGWGRAGWYTARWVDRLFFPANGPSADRVIPELQDIGVGTFIPDGPPRAECGLFVVELQEERVLVLRSNSHLPLTWRQRAELDWTWAFALSPIDHGRRTRYHFRSRWVTEPWWFSAVGLLGVVPADFVMARDHLRGVKRRAESSLSSPTAQGEEATVRRPARLW